ncbi:MAG: SOS cell division inhibitor SulA [Pseudomonadota bacterium]
MSGDPSALNALLENPRVWRGHNQARATAGLSSGYPALDRCLPGGGWPVHSLSEILLENYGIGELELLMPALASLAGVAAASQTGAENNNAVNHEQPGWIAWIAPPFQPYPPALEQWRIDLSRLLIVHPRNVDEVLWSAEQALSSGTCGAVLLWSAQLDDQSGRRLQLAAEKARSWAVAFRPLRARHEPSAAALRIALEAGAEGTDLSILKSRGGRPAVLKRFFKPDAQALSRHYAHSADRP